MSIPLSPLLSSGNLHFNSRISSQCQNYFHVCFYKKHSNKSDLDLQELAKDYFIDNLYVGVESGNDEIEAYYPVAVAILDAGLICSARS